MTLIVKNEYDFITFRNLMRESIHNFPNAHIEEFTDPDTNHLTFRILNLGIYIECQLIPEYITQYKEVYYDRTLDKLERIREILDE